MRDFPSFLGLQEFEIELEGSQTLRILCYEKCYNKTKITKEDGESTDRIMGKGQVQVRPPLSSTPCRVPLRHPLPMSDTPFSGCFQFFPQLTFWDLEMVWLQGLGAGAPGLARDLHRSFPAPLSLSECLLSPILSPKEVQFGLFSQQGPQFLHGLVCPVASPVQFCAPRGWWREP